MDLYDLVMNRRSVRNFKDQPVPGKIIEKLLDAASNAPSGGNMQPVSIILVQEEKNKKELSELVGNQPWVKNAPLSMIFCLDFNRIKRWAVLSGTEFKGEQAFLHFMIAYADLMITAETIVLLADSYSLGSVYIGTVLATMDQVRERFSIPDFVLPMMVLSIGYPKSVPKGVPKLPKDFLFHKEKYHQAGDDEIQKAFSAKYGTFKGNDVNYLEKVFIEAVEADKQAPVKWKKSTMKEITKLEIKNNAEFLFKFRYPTDEMVKMNKELFKSLENAGFNFLPKE